MPTDGDDDANDMARAIELSRQSHKQQLDDAKADAARRGKEPFDLEKLEQLCDTSHEGRMPPLEERYAEFESRYYVGYPEVMTLTEFAKEVEILNRW